MFSRSRSYQVSKVRRSIPLCRRSIKNSVRATRNEACVTVLSFSGRAVVSAVVIHELRKVESFVSRNDALLLAIAWILRMHVATPLIDRRQRGRLRVPEVNAFVSFARDYQRRSLKAARQSSRTD